MKPNQEKNPACSFKIVIKSVDNVDFVVIARKGVEPLEYAELKKKILTSCFEIKDLLWKENKSEEEMALD